MSLSAIARFSVPKAEFSPTTAVTFGLTALLSDPVVETLLTAVQSGFPEPTQRMYPSARAPASAPASEALYNCLLVTHTIPKSMAKAVTPMRMTITKPTMIATAPSEFLMNFTRILLHYS
jgi:hypothetical protein